jgi:hypothetical protein
MNIRYPIYEGVYRILTEKSSRQRRGTFRQGAGTSLFPLVGRGNVDTEED